MRREATDVHTAAYATCAHALARREARSYLHTLGCDPSTLIISISWERVHQCESVCKREFVRACVRSFK